jgi:uncharacterized protein
MSNLATVQAIYQAFATGDIATILGHMAEDVQWEAWADNHAQQAGVPWLAAKQGQQGVLEFFQTFGTLTVIKDFQVLSLMEGSNQVAVEFVIEYDVPSTGGHVRDEEIHLWAFNGAGQVTRLRHYTDTAKHIAAAKVRQTA